MRLDVGPVTPVSAVAWVEWARGASEDIRARPASVDTPSAGGLDHLGLYLDQWRPGAGSAADTFRWRADVDPDHLEYLAQALFSLDRCILAGAPGDMRSGVPDEARGFHLVLVRALLHALGSGSGGRAAFADQLRHSWPAAAEAS